MAKTDGTQNIPSELLDGYRAALGEERPDNGVGKRYPYRLPPMQTEVGHPSPAQKDQRAAFLAAIERWNSLDAGSRNFLFDWCKGSGLWYYDFFLRQRLYPMPNYWHECDIDNNVPHRLYVHLSVAAIQVNLYLFGAKFRAQFYTELGQHNHALAGALADDGAHDHSISEHTHGGVTGYHTHSFDACQQYPEGSETGGEGGGDNTDSDGPGVSDSAGLHSHGLGTVAVQNKGVAGEALSTVLKDYFNGMTIEVDGVDKTAALLALIGWGAFGDGSAGHVFNLINGTGKVDITSLITWSAGQHYIDFKQSGAVGGRLRYALYFD